MKRRPVDLLPKPAEFAYDRLTAFAMYRCAKCGKSVPPTDEMEEEDLREYLISALCPACFESIFPPEEECE